MGMADTAATSAHTQSTGMTPRCQCQDTAADTGHRHDPQGEEPVGGHDVPHVAERAGE